MSAFYRLPVELLTIIAQCVTEEKEWFKEGKALRLAHPHFANLDYLNVHLFHNINFHATPEGIDRLKVHPQALKSFVRKVTFLPSEYGTDMTLFHFRRIIIKQCAFYRPSDCRLVDHPTQRGAEYLVRLESDWANDPLFSPEELLASYQEYRKQAQAAQALLTDSSLQVWTDTIRQLPNVKTFEYGKHKEQGFRCEPFGTPPRLIEQDSDEKSDKQRSSRNLPLIPHPYYGLPCRHVPREPVCRILPDHPHDEEDFGLYDDESYHPSSVCRPNAIRTQAGLIEPISTCIHNAGVQPEKVILSSALTTFEPKNPLPPNLRSHLSGLRSLEWRARLFKDGSHHTASTPELHRFLNALLQQCHSSLQNLSVTSTAGEEGIGSDTSPVWPPKQIKQLPLPQLRHLNLSDFINPRNLALWISSLPHLEALTLIHGFYAAEGGLHNYRFALDAIRSHPSLLHVELKLSSMWILEESHLAVAVDIFTRNSPRTKREVRMSFGDRWGNKYELEKEGDSLCRWLGGEECEWDRRLDRFFPVRDPLPWE